MLFNDVKELEENYKRACDLLNEKNKKIAELTSKVRKYKDCCLMILPEKVYTHKARRNTTVKFKDGSSVTVTRKQGEKDCLETAIAYCILKQLLSAADVKELIKNKEEH